MTPEFSRPLPLERIPRAGLTLEVAAEAAECAALATRMAIPAVLALSCRFDLAAGPGGLVLASGQLKALTRRICVVSLDEFDTETEERFRLRFVPAGRESEDDDPNSDDEVPYQGGLIDLGEAAAEQLALALDPWPRKPGARLPEADEAAQRPFAALARRARSE